MNIGSQKRVIQIKSNTGYFLSAAAGALLVAACGGGGGSSAFGIGDAQASLKDAVDQMYCDGVSAQTEVTGQPETKNFNCVTNTTTVSGISLQQILSDGWVMGSFPTSADIVFYKF